MATVSDKRIPSLDGLRAISILFVLWSHAAGTTGFPFTRAQAQRFGEFGALGVRIFFVISGYLITRLLLQERARSGTISLRGFYLRRSFRIFPAFLTYVGLCAVAGAIGWLHIEPHDYVYALTYTMDFHIPHSGMWQLGHLWSLSVEEQFYFLWPALVILLGNRGALVSAAATLLIAPICRYATYRLWPAGHVLIGLSFPTVADSIATGCLLAGLEGHLTHPAWKKFATSPWFVLVPLAGLAANQLDQHPLVDLMVARGFINLTIALVIHRVVTWPEGAAGALLNWRPMVWLGTLSYSLYLWQQPFLDHASDARVCQFPMNLVLTLVAGYASYRLIERPLLLARVRWFRPAEPKPAPYAVDDESRRSQAR